MHIEAWSTYIMTMASDLVALVTSDHDVAYVRANFDDTATLARGRCSVERLLLLAGRCVPAASYRLVDGSLWFARDVWRLFDDAGCASDADEADSVTRVHALFDRRYRAAAAAVGFRGDAAGDRAAYLSGDFGVCLRDVTPETIVWKERLVVRIDAALADPRPDDCAWLDDVGADIAMLDGLVRPFASCDRARFGGTTSRDRLIAAARSRYPGLV